MSMNSPKRRRVNATGRNTYERFIALRHYMLRSPAWKTLSPNAKALLMEVWGRHNGVNNGEIAYAVREAEEIGLSKDQAGRAFKELVERGFLKVRKAASFTLKTKEARTWELTAERCCDGPPSKDFMHWAENKSRSHQRDAQSHQRDTSPTHETIKPVSVVSTRPSGWEVGGLQSYQRDTCSVPEGGEGNASLPTLSMSIAVASINNARKRLGWSVRRLAAEAGIPSGSLSPFLAGRYALPSAYLAKLAAPLNIDLEAM